MPVELTLDVQQRGAVRVHAVPSFAPLGVDAFFTDRSGGVSEGPYASLNLALHVGDDEHDVLENRQRVAGAIGATIDSLLFVNQVHGDRVFDASTSNGNVDADADALFCSTPHVALAILVADCVPILLADDHHVAVVHAGWRGLRSSVISNAVGKFTGSRNIHALLGPSISRDHYEVGPEVADLFRHVPNAIINGSGDRSFLDLRGVAAHQLLALGLNDANVAIAAASTDSGVTFFSDRAFRPCGRFALVAKRSS